MNPDMGDLLGKLTEERRALQVWLSELVAVRERDLSSFAKLKAALRTANRAKDIWPIMRNLGRSLRRHGWDRRKGGFRWFMGVAVATIAAFGFQGADIAAFGGAIGLPLWIVLGGGAAACHALLDGLKRPVNHRGGGE